MNSWNDDEAKRNARLTFNTELAKPGNEDDRWRCINEPSFARKKFAELGQFFLEENKPSGDLTPAIPLNAEFRVFPLEEDARKNVIILVLRPNDEQDRLYDQKHLWQCTYYPYKPAITDPPPEEAG